MNTDAYFLWYFDLPCTFVRSWKCYIQMEVLKFKQNLEFEYQKTWYIKDIHSKEQFNIKKSGTLGEKIWLNKKLLM